MCCRGCCRLRVGTTSSGDPRACLHHGREGFGQPSLQLCPHNPPGQCPLSPRLTPRHADRRTRCASPHSPGAGDPAAGGSSCGRSGGRRRGWRPAGRSCTPCTPPAAPPAAPSDVPEGHPAPASWLPATGLETWGKPDGEGSGAAPSGCPRWIHPPHSRGSPAPLRVLGPAGWFAVGGCGGKLEHQEHGEQRRGGGFPRCSWPCTTYPSPGDNGCFLGPKKDTWGCGSEGAAGKRTHPHPQGSKGGRAAERDTCPCCAAGTRRSAGHPWWGGQPGCTSGCLGKRQGAPGPVDEQQNPRQLRGLRPRLALGAGQHQGGT